MNKFIFTILSEKLKQNIHVSQNGANNGYNNILREF